MNTRLCHLALVAIGLTLAACNEKGSDGLTIAFASGNQGPDPVVQDFAVAYIRRAVVFGDDADPISSPVRTPDVFEPGADLVLKDRAEPSAPERSLLDGLREELGDDAQFDIRDLAVDYDGERLAFALRGPYIDGADIEDQPTWNIWLYDAVSGDMRRVIDSDIVAEAGNDRQPQFLPDGRIVFSSDRQRRSRAILLDEGRPQFAALDEDRREHAFVLHVMNDDGTQIDQLTFNQSHDQDPAVTADGRIVFTRWDNTPGTDVVSLYRVNPDGSAMERLYGRHSQDSGRDGSNIDYRRPIPLEDGRILTLAQARGVNSLGADLLRLDVAGYVDAALQLDGTVADGGQDSPIADIVQLSSPSIPGRFASAWPLFDGTDRLLVAWSPCRLVEDTGAIVPCTDGNLARIPALEEADPLFGLWIRDVLDDTQQPVVAPTEGEAITEAVVLSPRPAPTFIPATTLDASRQALADAGVGILHIRSVYDFDGGDVAPGGLATLENPSITAAADRPARFIRLVKAVSLPDRDLVNLPGTAFGRSQGELMREIMGYAVVHPDGSAEVQVPANVPFAISVLDASGRRITARHRNWLQVRPGENLECNGCHTTGTESTHGRSDADLASINPGGPFSGLNPAFVVNAGETMAEAYARENGVPAPTLDPTFSDIWTDPTARAPDADLAYHYADLSSAAPASVGCVTDWAAACRITINYEEHIHPLWAVDRRVFDTDGTTLLADNTCTACHSNVDAMGMARIPEAQLDLTDGASNEVATQFKSYRELLANDAEQELVNGALVDRLVPLLDGNGNPVFETDANGDLVLDAGGNPIPVMTTINVNPSMSTAGALASPRFFSRFDAGGTHAGYLTPAELRLIAEWLDIGAQYYNDPFKVPQ